MKKINFKALLKNENVMYVVLFVTTVSAFGYLMANNVEAITLMAAVGFLTWNFSKNMTVVLGTALLVTNIVYGVRRFEGFKEGNDHENEGETEEETEDAKNEMVTKEGVALLNESEEDEEDNVPIGAEESSRLMKELQHYEKINKEAKKNNEEAKKTLDQAATMMDDLKKHLSS